MLNKITSIINFFKKKFEVLPYKKHYTPIYRIISVHKSNEDYHEVTVQIINENNAFNARPEEILADDNFVDLFSPRDVRTLTYLGYLEINSPKYKILAKRLSEEHDKTFFALKEKGKKNILVKTASDIHLEKEILRNLESHDAHIIGYTAASESIADEKNEMQKILARNKEEKNIA